MLSFPPEEYAGVNTIEKFSFDPGKYKCDDWKCFRVRVYPLEVSFSGIYLWEIGDAGDEAELFFSMLSAADRMHMPAKPDTINDINETADFASIALTEAQWEAAKNYYLANQNNFEKYEAYVKETDVLQAVIGKLTWSCPIRWSLKNPGEDTRTRAQCISENVMKNENLHSDGELLPRRQVMQANYNIDTAMTNKKEDFINVEVEKSFNVRL